MSVFWRLFTHSVLKPEMILAYLLWVSTIRWLRQNWKKKVFDFTLSRKFFVWLLLSKFVVVVVSWSNAGGKLIYHKKKVVFEVIMGASEAKSGIKRFFEGALNFLWEREWCIYGRKYSTADIKYSDLRFKYYNKLLQSKVKKK